jgi:hypothetical protein
MTKKKKTYTLFTRFQLPPDTDPDSVKGGIRVSIKREGGEFTGLDGGVDIVIRGEG